MTQIEKYSAKIKTLTAEIKKIHKFAEDAGTDVSAEDSNKIDDILSQIDGLKKSIEQLKAVEDVEDEAPVEASKQPEWLQQPNKKRESAGRYSKPVEGAVHQDEQRYSLLRAISRFMEAGRVDGLEGEVNQEYAKRKGKTAEGFYMPMTQTYGNLDTTTGAGAVQTVKRPENFIELLRSKTLASKLGVKFITDLVGNISIPKQTGGATAYWLNSDGSSSVTISNQTIGQVPLVPNTCGAYSVYTRQFLKQTGMDAENFVRDDIAQAVALEIDRVIFAGSGVGSEPEGVLHNSSVPTVSLGTSGGAPTADALIDLETSIVSYNADVDSMSYVTTPQGNGKMKKTLDGSNTAAKKLLEGGESNNFPVYRTNQLPHNLTKGPYGTGLSPIIFGNWADILCGQWGAADVLVNPYTNDAYGSVRVTMMNELDVAIRHPESFAMCVDMVTT